MKFSLLLFAGAAALPAHDLYLYPRAFRVAAGQTGTVEFHNGDSFPKSEGPPVLERVRDLRVISSRGEQPVTGLRVDGKAAVASFRAPDGPGFLITARTTPNFIELGAAQFEAYLEHESLTGIVAARKRNGESGKPGRELYSKYVKAILHTGGPDPFLCKPAGLTIEFVPMVDPASLQLGQRLPVQVLYRGAPAPGLHVEASSYSNGVVKQRQLGRTDAQGKILVPLDAAGLWKLHAILMERQTNPAEADWESYWASLTFEITP